MKFENREWDVKLHDKFKIEFEELDLEIREELIKHVELLGKFGPQLGRPKVDTLKGSKYSNMKELRFRAKNGVWRVAFAYDPMRQAILLVAGNKSGVSEIHFYKGLIKKADERFFEYLNNL